MCPHERNSSNNSRNSGKGSKDVRESRRERAKVKDKEIDDLAHFHGKTKAAKLHDKDDFHYLDDKRSSDTRIKLSSLDQKDRDELGFAAVRAKNPRVPDGEKEYYRTRSRILTENAQNERNRMNWKFPVLVGLIVTVFGGLILWYIIYTLTK